ncbi:MAG: hypothetical protein SF123_21445 [Chloroflexota bacterium]|nr:hypothetical protein [Chloroflexota bacterium]
MSDDGQLLWRINNEYRLRLTKAQNTLNLLVQILQLRTDESYDVLDGLYTAQRHLAAMSEAHRAWRYRHYYDSSDERRMVQDTRSIERALAAFSRMYSPQQHLVHEIWQSMNLLSRPAAFLTSVPNGDLWELNLHSLTDLATFDQFIQVVVS